MKNIKLIAVTFLAVVGIITLTATVRASDATTTATPSLSVNAIYSGAKTVSGKATKGVNITVKSSAKKNLGTAVASKSTGKYTVKLSKALKSGSSVYVYARAKGATKYFYRIIHVQAAKSKTNVTKVTKTATKATTAKTTTTKTTTSTVKKVSPATPTGTWTSNSVNGYKLRYTFSQKTGFSSNVIKSGKSKAVISNATYNVTAKATNFWKITTKTHSGKKGTFYVRFSSNKKFTLVNSKNQKVKVSIGNAPKAVYTLTK